MRSEQKNKRLLKLLKKVLILNEKKHVNLQGIIVIVIVIDTYSNYSLI